MKRPSVLSRIILCRFIFEKKIYYKSVCICWSYLKTKFGTVYMKSICFTEEMSHRNPCALEICPGLVVKVRTALNREFM